MKCVECLEEATEGSAQHPYCAPCFKKVWNDDYEAYNAWLVTHHNNPQDTLVGAITFIIGLVFLIVSVLAVVGLAVWGLISLCS